MREDSLGIYCLKDKVFYYLESGDVYVANTVDRIKKTLIARDLIEFTPGNYSSFQGYKVIPCREASLEGYTMAPIYITKNIKDAVLKENDSDGTNNSRWSKT